jgi:hypothetical protein
MVITNMPRGGNHGGGRPKLPPDRVKTTAAYSLNPVLVKTISDVAESRNISKSELVESILVDYFEE